MDLVTRDLARDRPNNYQDISGSLCGMNVKSTRVPTTAVSYLVATSSSQSLPNNDEKSNQPKRPLFPKWDEGRGLQQKQSFINLYWKNGRTGNTGGFCKHISGSLYIQVVEVICQEAAVTPHALYDIKNLARPG